MVKLREEIEYIIHCDEKGEIIGPISKEHAHLKGARQVLTHHSTWCMVFHPPTGKYGIQLKDIRKHDSTSAGKWDTGVGGHNCYTKQKEKWVPMSFEETVVKEADEEIGLQVEVIDSLTEFVKQSKNLKRTIAFIFDKFHHATEKNNEFVGFAFILVPTIQVEFKDNEVIDFQWLLPLELKVFIEQNKDQICEALLCGFERAEKFRKKYLDN